MMDALRKLGYKFSQDREQNWKADKDGHVYSGMAILRKPEDTLKHLLANLEYKERAKNPDVFG